MTYEVLTLSRRFMAVRGQVIATDDGTTTRMGHRDAALLRGIMAGLGRVDVLARHLAGAQAIGHGWVGHLRSVGRAGGVLSLACVSRRLWGMARGVLLDWNGDLAPSALRGLRILSWRREQLPRNGADGRKRPKALKCECLFESAQAVRGMLGCSSSKVVVLGGATDRVLFGDLVHRHRSIVLLGREWPEARRVWQAARDMLGERGRWLEEVYYAMRHGDSDNRASISARGGTALAGQEVRAIVDASVVVCWDSGQREELERFYGRRPSDTIVLCRKPSREMPNIGRTIRRIVLEDRG